MEHYDTGIYYFYPEDKYLYFGGMLGDEHETAEAGLELIRKQMASDIQDGTASKLRTEGEVILYFLSHFEPQEPPKPTLITMTVYVSGTYDKESLDAVKDYGRFDVEII